ncbi:hypothetical protein KSS87_011746 [Heliosperma pusillum]|nr:hypothetical protein KSS87_011746 [Heliosperma pusillum]
MTEGFRLSQQEKCGNEENRKHEDNGKTVEKEEIVDNKEHEENEENVKNILSCNVQNIAENTERITGWFEAELLAALEIMDEAFQPIQPHHSPPKPEFPSFRLLLLDDHLLSQPEEFLSQPQPQPETEPQPQRQPETEPQPEPSTSYGEADQPESDQAELEPDHSEPTVEANLCLDNVDVAAAQLILTPIIAPSCPPFLFCFDLRPESCKCQIIHPIKDISVDYTPFFKPTQDRLINLLQLKLSSVTRLTSMAMPEEAQLRRFALRVCHQIATCSGNLSKEIVEKDAIELSSSLGLPFTDKELAVDAETNPEIWGQYIKPQYTTLQLMVAISTWFLFLSIVRSGSIGGLVSET